MANLNRFNIVMRSDSDVWELEDSPNGKYIKFDDIKDYLPSASHNTTNGKIKPCSNKECDLYNSTDSEGLNCTGFFTHSIKECENYSA